MGTGLAGVIVGSVAGAGKIINIELVFDKVPTDTLSRLTLALLEKMNVTRVSHSEIGDVDLQTLDQGFVDLLCQQNECPFVVSVLGSDITIGSVHIRNPMLRFIRADGENMVELGFDDSDIEGARDNFVVQIATEAKVLADHADVMHYFCGFEPATDESTRLFTGGKIGPLRNI
jgi:hypothetical protein